MPTQGDAMRAFTVSTCDARASAIFPVLAAMGAAAGWTPRGEATCRADYAVPV